MSANRLPGQSPGLQVIRWSKAPTAGTTTLSGLDDYSVGLTYTAGYESVYLNGVLLDRTTDYTATNGTTIVLGTATVAGDIVNVFGTQISPVNGSVPTSTYTTKGDILVATANNTVVRQGVGANGTVLTANSAQADGVEWVSALPSQSGQSGNYLTTNGTAASWGAISAGGMTLISTTALSGSSITLSSIPQTYKDLKIVIRNFRPASDNDSIGMRFNGNSTSYSGQAAFNGSSSLGGDRMYDIVTNQDNGTSTSLGFTLITDYTNSSTWKIAISDSITNNATTPANYNYQHQIGLFGQTSAITSITLLANNTTFTSGTVLLYGVN